MIDKKDNDALYNVVRTVLLGGLTIVLCLLIISIFPSKSDKQIMCFEKEVYVLGNGNVSCILCKNGADNYMSCDYDRVNRSLKGVFYR